MSGKQKGWAERLEDQRAMCANRKAHTEGPEGYLQWFGWVEKKVKTHKQVECDGCGRYLIWVKRVNRVPS